MVKHFAWVALLIPVVGWSAQYTGAVSVTSIESRKGGYHQIRIGSLVAAQSFPDEKCDLMDVGIIDDAFAPLSNKLFRMALTALVARTSLKFVVEGCSPTRATTGPTDFPPDAPRIVGVRYE